MSKQSSNREAGRGCTAGLPRTRAAFWRERTPSPGIPHAGVTIGTARASGFLHVTRGRREICGEGVVRTRALGAPGALGTRAAPQVLRPEALQAARHAGGGFQKRSCRSAWCIDLPIVYTPNEAFSRCGCYQNHQHAMGRCPSKVTAAAQPPLAGKRRRAMRWNAVGMPRRLSIACYHRSQKSASNPPAPTSASAGSGARWFSAWRLPQRVRVPAGPARPVLRPGWCGR